MPVEKHPYEFKLIKAKDITVNRLYQRDAHRDIVKEIINHFDYHKVNPVKVVFHDDAYYAFDGQQTTTGLRTKFGDDYLIPCFIYYDVPTWVDEAILFEGINSRKARKPVSQKELWKSRIARKEDVATDIVNILRENNLMLSLDNNSTVTGKVRALNTLDSQYAKIGPVKMREVFNIIATAWHGEPNSISNQIINGMCIFVDKYYGEYDKTRLISKLSKTPALNLIVAGRASVASGNNKYASEILNTYNKNASKSQLPNRL